MNWSSKKRRDKLEAGTEKMFFFHGSRNRRLLGFLHLPANNSRSLNKTGVVYCHPFGEEKMASHAIVVKTARALCEKGFIVMRFDFSGCGDSEGELDETTLDDWNEDLRCAIEVLKAEARPVRMGLWGLRLGASLVLEYARNWQPNSTPDDLAFLLLWQPVPDPEVFIKQFLRQKMSTEIASKTEGEANREGGVAPSSVKGLIQSLENNEGVEVIGYPISKALYRSFVARAKPALPLPDRYPVLVATASLSAEAAPGPKKLAESLALLGHRVQMEHIQEEPFWDRLWRWNSPNLLATTVLFAEGAR
jgi:uncharacterized protein